MENMTFSKQEVLLVLEIVSSEDSEEEEVLMVHPLPWKASKVDTMFKRLDDTINENSLHKVDAK